jgi:hypothetical protein
MQKSLKYTVIKVCVCVGVGVGVEWGVEVGVGEELEGLSEEFVNVAF